VSGLIKKNIDTSIKFVYSDNNSLSVIFHDNDLLMGVVGEFNKNLKELEKITDENKYTKKVDIPVYEPTDEKPEIGELYDIAKCQELLQQINGADISAEEKIFLTAAAYRHVSFHFENIANFYAHSNKDIQELMENSALVIIDFDKAIEQGYVTLSDKISDQYTKDYPDEG